LGRRLRPHTRLVLPAPGRYEAPAVHPYIVYDGDDLLDVPPATISLSVRRNRRSRMRGTRVGPWELLPRCSTSNLFPSHVLAEIHPSASAKKTLTLLPSPSRRRLLRGTFGGARSLDISSSRPSPRAELPPPSRVAVDHGPCRRASLIERRVGVVLAEFTVAVHDDGRAWIPDLFLSALPVHRHFVLAGRHCPAETGLAPVLPRLRVTSAVVRRPSPSRRPARDPRPGERPLGNMCNASEE